MTNSATDLVRTFNVEVNFDPEGPLYLSDSVDIPGFTAWGDSYESIIDKIFLFAPDILRTNFRFIEPSIEWQDLNQAVIQISNLDNPSKNLRFPVNVSAPPPQLSV